MMLQLTDDKTDGVSERSLTPDQALFIPEDGLRRAVDISPAYPGSCTIQENNYYIKPTEDFKMRTRFSHDVRLFLCLKSCTF